MSLFLTIIILLAVAGLILLVANLWFIPWYNWYYSLEPDETDQAIIIRPGLTAPTKTPKAEKHVSKNQANNFHKAALKARRQGHLRFMFHGDYYTTGLYRVDGERK